MRRLVLMLPALLLVACAASTPALKLTDAE
jgi:hypothetical protein